MKVEWVRVGEVLRLSREPITVEDGKTYRKIGIYSWGRGMIHHPPTPAAEMGSLRYFSFPADALVLSNIQAWEQAVAISTAVESEEFVCSNRFLPYVPRTPDVDVRYVLHHLLSEAGHELLKRASPGTQVRNRTLGKQLFEDSVVPLPSLVDQRRIAGHLNRLAGVREPLLGRTWGRSFKARLLKVGTVEVAQTPLMALLDAVPEVEVRAEHSYDIAGIYSFGRGFLRRPTIRGEETKYKTLTRLSTDDVVYSKLGAFEGAVAVVDDHFTGSYVSPEFPTFRLVSDQASVAYLRHYLTSPLFQEKLAAATAGVGARQKRVAPSVFLGQLVPVPSETAQRSLSRTLDRVDTVQARADRATALRTALLPSARNQIFTAMR